MSFEPARNPVGQTLLFGVGPNLLGRIFDSVGRPIDGGPPVAARAVLAV